MAYGIGGGHGDTNKSMGRQVCCQFTLTHAVDQSMYCYTNVLVRLRVCHWSSCYERNDTRQTKIVMIVGKTSTRCLVIGVTKRVFVTGIPVSIVMIVFTQVLMSELSVINVGTHCVQSGSHHFLSVFCSDIKCFEDQFSVEGKLYYWKFYHAYTP